MGNEDLNREGEGWGDRRHLCNIRDLRDLQAQMLSSHIIFGVRLKRVSGITEVSANT